MYISLLYISIYNFSIYSGTCKFFCIENLRRVYRADFQTKRNRFILYIANYIKEICKRHIRRLYSNVLCDYDLL